MSEYPEYSTFADTWFSQIPSHWQFLNIGDLFTQRKEKVSDKDYAPLSVTKNGVMPQLETAAKNDDGDNRKLVCAGDFVINSRSDRKGSCGVSPLDGSVSLINIVLQPRVAMNMKYVHYLLRCQSFSEEFYRNGRGIVADLWTTRYSEMKTILVPVPPREEQDQIVRYLDSQVAKINRLIAAKKRQIELVKEAGNHYLDDAIQTLLSNAPRSRLKYVMELVVDCPHETPEYDPVGEYLVIRTADEDFGFLRSDDNMYRLKEDEYQIRIRRAPLLKDDIVYGREGERWGLACLVPDSDKYCLGQRMMQFRCNRNMIIPSFAMWVLNSSYVRNQGVIDTMGSTSPHVNISTIINYSMPLPSLEKQKEFANDVDKYMRAAQQIISKFEQEIRCCEDLCVRIISDVITGQVDVRK